MRLCIHPVDHSSLMAASTKGYPVRPCLHACAIIHERHYMNVTT